MSIHTAHQELVNEAYIEAYKTLNNLFTNTPEVVSKRHYIHAFERIRVVKTVLSGLSDFTDFKTVDALQKIQFPQHWIEQHDK